MDNKVKNVLLIVLAIGLIGMTGAYALLSQQLSVVSTATVKGASWDVHIENLSGPTFSSTAYGNTSASTGATGTATTDDPATIVQTPSAASATSISGLAVQFTKPNVSVSYTFDLVNAGTLDAILDSYYIAAKTGDHAFTCTGTGDNAVADAELVCNNLTYTLKYTDGGADVAATNTLDKATVSGNTSTPTRRNVTLTLTLADMATLPTNDVTVSGLNVDFNYVQK